MGKSSEAAHPRKDPAYKAKKQLELVHTDLAGPFKPRAIEGTNRYNLSLSMISAASPGPSLLLQRIV